MGTNKFLQFLFGIAMGSLISLVIYSTNLLSSESSRLDVNKNIRIPKISRDLYNETLADKLFNEVRLLCWVMTTPANHKTRAVHIRNTWGKRCNKLLFMSTSVDVELGSVALPVKEGRDPLWDKTKNAFQYVYNHHFDDADWFLKADDDK